MVNRAVLTGHVFSDPEFVSHADDGVVLLFRLAVSRGRRSVSGREVMDWLDIVCDERTAITPGLAKGALIAVEGRLQSYTRTRPDGQPVRGVKIAASRVWSISSRWLAERSEAEPRGFGTASSTGGATHPQANSVVDDGLPHARVRSDDKWPCKGVAGRGDHSAADGQQGRPLQLSFPPTNVGPPALGAETPEVSAPAPGAAEGENRYVAGRLPTPALHTVEGSGPCSRCMNSSMIERDARRFPTLLRCRLVGGPDRVPAGVTLSCAQFRDRRAAFRQEDDAGNSGNWAVGPLIGPNPSGMR
ncbi:MAG: single-stranded DNA-binding protein [Armatimonadetes bacterium]|nr:single-stranded DNA-binding protein [Armatimonadota bacterium]